jgi:hypothetical protein
MGMSLHFLQAFTFKEIKILFNVLQLFLDFQLNYNPLFLIYLY